VAGGQQRLRRYPTALWREVAFAGPHGLRVDAVAAQLAPEALQPRKQQSTKGIAPLRPSEGLQIAYDPRIPKDAQAFEFVVGGVSANNRVAWTLNGNRLSKTDGGHFVWPVERGTYTLQAQELSQSEDIVSAMTVHFSVK